MKRQKGLKHYLLEVYYKTVHSLFWKVKVLFGDVFNARGEADRGGLVIFDTSCKTNNLGDEIIMDYCSYWLQDVKGYNNAIRITVHSKPKNKELCKVHSSMNKIVCGTNLLYSDMSTQRLWKFGNSFNAYKGICLMGVGWNGYENRKIDIFTKYFYKHYLSNSMLHSVRDEYTRQKLLDIGIRNVINTACPTMWKLTPEFCKGIPYNKAENVITTLTDYKRDYKNDKIMIDILCANYKNVYLWLQGSNDYVYLKELGALDRIKIIDASLNQYDSILKKDNVEYVGTRLHAGIRALNFGKRTIIIAVDNRAIEIARDTNLNIVLRDEVHRCLSNQINSDFKTEIVLPEENINLWKAQFR